MRKKKQQQNNANSSRRITLLKRGLAASTEPTTSDSGKDIVVPATLVFHVAPKDHSDQTQKAELTQIVKGLATLATALWRIRSKLVDDALPEMPHELRHLPRHVQAAWDALEACHIKVQDHKDERYLPGMAVNPITFQPTAGLATEVICETIKPSIFYHDTLIQRADVIIAQPIDTNDDDQAQRSGTDSH
jgi:hypothetical protein